MSGVSSSPSYPTNNSSPHSQSVASATTTSPPIHPAFTISNITNFIKITLSIEKSQYNTWSELFKIHARVHQVIDHIIPTEASPSPDLKTTDPNIWKRLDDVVLQWIYGTISDDLLHTIIERDFTAEQAWNWLFNIFNDTEKYIKRIERRKVNK